MTQRVQVVLPRHLGDAVLTLGAVESLLGLGPVWLSGGGFTRELFGHLDVHFGWTEAADLAVLFKPSFSAAWQARRAARRVGLATDGRWPLLDVAVVPGRGHRIEDFAAIVRAAGAPTPRLPHLPTAVGPSLAGHQLLLPGSRSGVTVRWPGYRALADRLAGEGVRVLFAGGPDEEADVAAIAGPHPRLGSTALHDIASAAARVDRVIGNDAGLSHLAAAARRGAGRSVSDVVVICGSTAPDRTAAPGASALRAPRPPPCWPCYRKSCPVGLSCMDFDPFAGADPAQFSVPVVVTE